MSRRREVAELAAGIGVLAVIYVAVRLFVSHVVLEGFFGRPTAANPAGGAVWSNLVASAVCLLAVWWRIRVQMLAHHAEQLAMAARHHQERTEQADRHHAEQVALAEKHHAEQLESVKAHVASLVKPGRRT